ncbi:MAG TPA: OmpA family protein [Myxococcaceae bacterium]|nr:OmpA family protein [Myxococcaceae bacterium]
MSNRIIGAVGIALLVAACGPSKDEFAAAQRDAANYKKQYQDETAKTAALEKKVGDLQTQNEALTKSTTQLTEEKGALEAKSKQYEELAGSLKQQIDSGQVEITELRGKMTVKLKDKVVFSSGSAAINKQGRDALDAVAHAFQTLKDKVVVVAGYTDSVPTNPKSAFKDNWDLSTARAVSVVRYLQTQGVDPKMLGAAGFSQYRPLAPNETEAGRSQNRRIEIALTAADYTPPVVDTPTAAPAAPAPQSSAQPAR